MNCLKIHYRKKTDEGVKRDLTKNRMERHLPRDTLGIRIIGIMLQQQLKKYSAHAVATV